MIKGKRTIISIKYISDAFKNMYVITNYERTVILLFKIKSIISMRNELLIKLYLKVFNVLNKINI